MFAEWVTEGAAFGINGFVALFMLGVLFLALAAVLAIVGYIWKYYDEKHDGD